MAWQAKLDRDIVGDPTSNKLVATVIFYDDVDAATILHSRAFALEPTTTTAQLQAAVVAEGKAARALLATAAAARATVPINTVIAIP